MWHLAQGRYLPELRTVGASAAKVIVRSSRSLRCSGIYIPGPAPRPPPPSHEDAAAGHTAGLRGAAGAAGGDEHGDEPGDEHDDIHNNNKSAARASAQARPSLAGNQVRLRLLGLQVLGDVQAQVQLRLPGRPADHPGPRRLGRLRGGLRTTGHPCVHVFVEVRVPGPGLHEPVPRALPLRVRRQPGPGPGRKQRRVTGLHRGERDKLPEHARRHSLQLHFNQTCNPKENIINVSTKFHSRQASVHFPP
ncbi:hypothetical protein FOCC_FOCC008373, partial [Frankliniella occidentalis]